MSRERILSAIRANQPSNDISLDDCAVSADGTCPVTFEEMVGVTGGTLVEVDSLAEVKAWVEREYGGQRVFSNVQGIEPGSSQSEPHEYEDVEFTLLSGGFAVAENAAVWIPTGKGGQQAPAFLAQQIGLVVSKTEIVPTMAEAYHRIQQSGVPDFGVFISGPSKTADIEQCLVIGAHGPKSLTVFMIS